MRLDLSNLSILLVDDSVFMRRIIKTYLTSFHVRHIMEADDGIQAIERLQSNRPDMVITDWLMPHINGLELTRHIRSEEKSPDPYMPVIMLSSYSERWRVIQARDSGVTEFLCKPISAKSLYLRIAVSIVKPRPFVRTKSFFGPDRRRFIDPTFDGAEKRLDAIMNGDDDAGEPAAKKKAEG